MAQVTNLAPRPDSAEEAGLTIYGSGRRARPQTAWTPLRTGMRLPAVLVLGNEDAGLRSAWLNAARILRIPLARPF